MRRVRVADGLYQQISSLGLLFEVAPSVAHPAPIYLVIGDIDRPIVHDHEKVWKEEMAHLTSENRRTLDFKGERVKGRHVFPRATSDAGFALGGRRDSIKLDGDLVEYGCTSTNDFLFLIWGL